MMAVSPFPLTDVMVTPVGNAKKHQGAKARVAVTTAMSAAGVNQHSSPSYIALQNPSARAAASNVSSSPVSSPQSSLSPSSSSSPTADNKTLTMATPSKDYSSAPMPMDSLNAVAVHDNDDDEEMNETVTTDGHGAAPNAATWRIEFRGVSKLIPWASKRGPTTNSNSNKLSLGGGGVQTDEEEKLVDAAELTGRTPSTSTTTSTSTSSTSQKLRRPRQRSNSIANVDVSLESHDDNDGVGNETLSDPDPTPTARTADRTTATGATPNVVKRLSRRPALTRPPPMTSRQGSNCPSFASASITLLSADSIDATLGSAAEPPEYGPGSRSTWPQRPRSSHELDGRRYVELRAMVNGSGATQVTRDLGNLVFSSEPEPTQQNHEGPQHQHQQCGQLSSSAAIPPKKRKLSKLRRIHPDTLPSAHHSAECNANSSSMTLPIPRGFIFTFGRRNCATSSNSPDLSLSSSPYQQLPGSHHRRRLSKTRRLNPVDCAPHLMSVRRIIPSLPEINTVPTISHPRSQTQVCEQEVVLDVTPSDEVMQPPRPHFHLYDNGADGVDSSPPSRTWSAEDIIFGGPPTPPLATARDDDPEHGYAWGPDDHDPHASKGLLPLPQLSHTRRGRRWSAVVTEIADDGDFLRELNRELALATRYFTATSDASGSHGDDGQQEEEGPGGVEVLPRRATMSEDGHGIGKRRNDVQMRMSVSMSTSAQSTQPSLMAPPGYDPRMESERLDKARKAMMCVREIVRTERSYLAHLRSVGEREVLSRSSVAPVLFLEHLPQLIAASKVFNTSLEKDASIWGVASSFVSCAPQLESALVKWSEVVGSAITSSSLTSTPMSSSSSPSSSSPSSSSTSSPLSRSSASSLPSVAPPARAGSLHSIFGGGGGGRSSGIQGQGQQFLSSLVMTVYPRSSGITVSEDGYHPASASSSTSGLSRSLTNMPRGGASLPSWRRSSAPPAPRTHEGSASAPAPSPTATPAIRTSLPATTPPSRSSSSSGPPPLPPKGLSLQDIAIMPTQRVVRYVMLYQDLLKLTPATSRSYPVVSEARACALRIAKSCNEAQRNLDLVSPQA